MVLSVNYHQVYDFAVEFNSHSIVPETSLGQVIGQRVTEEEGWSEGAVSAYTLAGGLSMPDCPEITLGAGINWYTHSIVNDRAWRIGRTTTVTTHWNSGGQDVFRSNHEETFDDFRAYNFTLGLLLDAHEKQENLLTFGLVYHTPFTARVDWEFISDSQPDPLRDETMDIDIPASFGAGVNYRFSDAFSAAFDVEWKEWSKFRQKYANGTQTSPVDDDTLAYRLGCEHLFLEDSAESVFACRGGAFYEPRPVTNYPDLVPVYGLSAGLGWTLMDQFSLDFAYQHRWGQKDLGNIDYEIKEDFFVLSVIKYF